MENKDKFIITIDCRAVLWEDIDKFIGVLQNTSTWGRLCNEYGIDIDNIFTDRDDY